LNKRPLTVTINLLMILINGLMWLILGIIIAFDLHPAMPDSPSMRTGMAIISILIFVLLGGFTFFLYKHNKMAYYLTLGFFMFTSILTIFDDFGITDLVVLLLGIIPIVLLIKDRKWYMHADQKIEEVA